MEQLNPVVPMSQEHMQKILMDTARQQAQLDAAGPTVVAVTLIAVIAVVLLFAVAYGVSSCRREEKRRRGMMVEARRHGVA